MVLDAIISAAAERPDAAAIIYNGQPVSFRQFSMRVQAARIALLTAAVPRTGIALLTLNNIGLTWPWLLALQSLGLTTIATSAAMARALDLGDLACIIGDHGETLDAAVCIGESDARQQLVEGHAEISGGRIRAGHMMLSSGTTGLPKLVLFGPDSLTATMAFPYVATTYDKTSVTYVGDFHLATAIGYLSPLRTWWRGGTVVIDQSSDLWTPFRRGTITEAFLTPGMLSGLLDNFPLETALNPRMNLSVVGGLAPWPLILRAMERLTPSLSALYGTTEVGRVACTPLLSPQDTFLYVIDDGREVQICDEDYRPVRTGDIGLVRIDTRAGILGYWRDPNATRTFFRDGWFYTGDLGRLHPDGRLELMGRANDVLVIGGDKRPAQIFEQRIRDAVPVSDVCIVQSAPGTGSDALQVFYETPLPLNPDAIARLKALLPSNVAVIVNHRERLPRNAMGKVTRLMLRADLPFKH